MQHLPALYIVDAIRASDAVRQGGRAMRRAFGSIAFVIVVALTVLLTGMEVASAISVVPNETFTFVADRQTPTVVPNVATAFVTIGSETSVNSGLFTVTNFVLDITNHNNDCLTCTMTGLTINMTLNAATLGLSGTLTGSFLGMNGGTHFWNPLTINDIPTGSATGTWSLIDDHIGANGQPDVRTSSGTYAPLTPVPEPSSLLLLVSGLAGLSGIGWRWR